MTDFPGLIEPVARMLFGEPNRHLSNPRELRFGNRGSLSIKIDGPHKGTWNDHEAATGGGVLDLVAREIGGDHRAAIEWLKREGFPVEDHAPPTSRRVIATYPYTDEAGELLFEVVRHEPKDFRQRRPDGNGGFIWNLKGVRQVPYRLPETIVAIAEERTVFIVEGEKDADRLWKLNIPATCNAGGAGNGKWRDDFAPLFEGAHVVIVPDNDDPGRNHAEGVARSLSSVAASVKVLALPKLPYKGDVSDWLNGGGTFEALHALAEAAPPWRPASPVRLPVVWFGDEDRQPPMAWLVKGLLPEGGLSTIYGPPGTSKSFLALDLALCIAHGLDWFGRSVAPGPVLYVSGEGATGMMQRMKAWRKEKGDGSRAPFGLIPSSVNLYDDDAGASALIDDIKAHGGDLGVPVRLVVLDTLSRMIGSGDEDKARDINVVVGRAERIQRETGAHVLIVHHSGKDRDRGMRGSNALLGAVDAAIEVSRDEASGIGEAKVQKLKDGSAPTPFRYVLRQSVLGVDEDGDDITSCVIDPTDANPGNAQGKGKLTDSDRIALDALDDAIGDSGTSSDSPGVPANVPRGIRIVRLSTWREYAYRKGIADGGDEARRKAFLRIRQKLQARFVIGCEGEWVWRARRE